MIYIAFSYGYLYVRTPSLNDKHSCQLFRMGLKDKTTPKLTTRLIRANISCAVATIFSSLAFLSSSVSMANLSRLVAASFCDHLLQPLISLQLIVVTSLQSFESGQAPFLVFFYFCILSSAFLSSVLVSELCLLYVSHL